LVPAGTGSGVLPLSELPAGAVGTIVEVRPTNGDRVDRLLALGVTPGGRVVVLQTFPGVVFQCDQTELAVERDIARVILVKLAEG
jgi:DtxR family Mn-dependent transcriptional regulator